MDGKPHVCHSTTTEACLLQPPQIITLYKFKVSEMIHDYLELCIVITAQSTFKNNNLKLIGKKG
jgi:phosphoenolpyruvate carboxylase